MVLQFLFVIYGAFSGMMMKNENGLFMGSWLFNCNCNCNLPL